MINSLSKLLTPTSQSVLNTQSFAYSFNKQNNNEIVWKNRVTLILKSYFSMLFCLIGKPVFIISPNKVKIHLFYYRPRLSSRRLGQLYRSFWYKWYNVASPDKRRSPKALNSENGRKLILLNSRFKYLAGLLSSLLKTNVELELVRLKYPHHDSEILAQLIAINGEMTTYSRIKKTLFTRTTIITKINQLRERSARFHAWFKQPTILDDKIRIATKLTGIRIRIAGRLALQRVVPKQTVKTAYKGGISKSIHILVSSSTHTSKNKRGAFTVKVWLGHGI